MLPYPFLTIPPPPYRSYNPLTPSCDPTTPLYTFITHFVQYAYPIRSIHSSKSFNPLIPFVQSFIPFVHSPHPIRSIPSSHLFNAPTSFIKSPHPIRSIPSSYSFNPLIPFVQSPHIPRTIPSFPMYVISLSWFSFRIITVSFCTPPLVQ